MNSHVTNKDGTHAPAMTDGMKPSNPKDALGAAKLPLHLVPVTATALASLAHLDGASKYGTWNWRVAGVRASTYLDAVARHLGAWTHGEDVDPESGVPHLGHAIACLNILVDAGAAGMLTDDRAVPIDIRKFFNDLTAHVPRIKANHAARSPRHYNRADDGRKVTTADILALCKEQKREEMPELLPTKKGSKKATAGKGKRK